MRLYIYEANNMPIFLFITIFNLWITNSVKAVGITLFKFFNNLHSNLTFFDNFCTQKEPEIYFRFFEKLP